MYMHIYIYIHIYKYIHIYIYVWVFVRQFNCGTPEDESWVYVPSFVDDKSPTLETCVFCLETLVFKVPECGFSQKGVKKGVKGDVQTTVVAMLQACTAQTAREVGEVMRKVYSHIRKAFMQFDWAKEYELGWLEDVAEAKSAKELYAAGKMLEEYGLDRERMLAVDVFCKMLDSIDNYWLDAQAVDFVRNVLPCQAVSQGGNIPGQTCGSRGLASLTAQLCDCLLGRVAQPLLKRESTVKSILIPTPAPFPHSVHVPTEVKCEVKVEGVHSTATLASPAAAPEHDERCDAYDNDDRAHDDDDDCVLMFVEDQKATGRFAERVAVISQEARDLWREAKPNRQADILKWRRLAVRLQYAIHLRSGVLPEMSCAADACHSSQHDSDDADDNDFGDIEEMDDASDTCESPADVHKVPCPDSDSLFRAHVHAHIDTRTHSAAKRKEPADRSPSPAYESKSCRILEDVAVPPPCASAPHLSDEQLLACTEKCGSLERTVLLGLDSICDWLRVVLGEDEVLERVHTLQTALQIAVDNLVAVSSHVEGSAAQLAVDVDKVAVLMGEVQDAKAAYLHAIAVFAHVHDDSAMNRAYELRETHGSDLKQLLRRARCILLAPFLAAASPHTASPASSGAATQDLWQQRQMVSADTAQHDESAALSRSGGGGGCVAHGKEGVRVKIEAETSLRDVSVPVSPTQNSVHVKMEIVTADWDVGDVDAEADEGEEELDDDPYACLFSDDDVDM